MSNEYKQLVGEGNTGDFVLTQQGGAEGFSNVSQFWMPNCLTFEDCIATMERQRANRRDITTDWKSWEFEAEGTSLKLVHQEEGEFVPTEHALNQALKYCSVSRYHVNQTLSPEFGADEYDMDQLVKLLNYRKQRHDKTNKAEDRELIFRTYSDNTLRAVLTTSYAPIDNRWFLEVLRDLIPGGMISHLRGDADSMWFNVLMPDNVRHEDDSDYGGMLSGKNSEIGLLSIDTCPGLFRSICQNGNIWDKTEGISFRKKHLGNIDLAMLAENIGRNLDEQIKILPGIMDEFLTLRGFQIKGTKMTNIFAQVAKDSDMTKDQITDMVDQWYHHEKEKTAFAVVNAITRMSQNQVPIVGNAFDVYSSRLIKSNWNAIVSKAKSLTADDISTIFKEDKKVVSA